MKHGKRASRSQQELLRRWGFDPSDWLISKNTPQEMVIVSRSTGKHRTIPKAPGTYNSH